jgi:acrylyl-CoA reductase (NADPH)
VAVSLLAKAGWHVIATTGRPAEADYLKGIGAAEIVERGELSSPPKPLAKERWAAGIDSVGSTTLANLLAMTRYGGAVAACGLAGGMDLPSSVAPFILRGVSLLGIDSVMAPKALRLEAYRRLAGDLDRAALDRMATTVPLEGAADAARALMAGEVKGRVVVEIG